MKISSVTLAQELCELQAKDILFSFKYLLSAVVCDQFSVFRNLAVSKTKYLGLIFCLIRSFYFVLFFEYLLHLSKSRNVL